MWQSIIPLLAKMGGSMIIKELRKLRKFDAYGSTIAGVGSEIGSQLLGHAFNRSDYNYTHNMTAAPQQVKELKEAGLNPALAYGQISAPQGQSLGSHQVDFSSAIDNFVRIPLLMKQADGLDADTSVKRANARYTNAMAVAQEYNNSHREESYLQEFKLKNLDITNKELLNTAQNLQNAILWLDWTAKPYIIETQMQHLLKQIQLFEAQAKSINQKLPKELDILTSQLDKLDAEIEYLKQQGLTEKEIRDKISAEARWQELANGMEEFLTANGTNYAGKAGWNIIESLIGAFGKLK